MRTVSFCNVKEQHSSFSYNGLLLTQLPICCIYRCDQYCGSNIVTTLTDLQSAIYEDVFGVLRLIGVCFGTQGEKQANAYCHMLRFTNYILTFLFALFLCRHCWMRLQLY